MTAYARQEIPVNRNPPITVMEKPTAGLVLHGAEFLLAGASDEYGITRVEFEQRVGQSGSNVIDVAAGTSFGWLGAWNTRTVPNGQYALRSVAIAAGGRRGTRKWVAVEVDI